MQEWEPLNGDEPDGIMRRQTVNGTELMTPDGNVISLSRTYITELSRLMFAVCPNCSYGRLSEWILDQAPRCVVRCNSCKSRFCLAQQKICLTV